MKKDEIQIDVRGWEPHPRTSIIFPYFCLAKVEDADAEGFAEMD